MNALMNELLHKEKLKSNAKLYCLEHYLTVVSSLLKKYDKGLWKRVRKDVRTEFWRPTYRRCRTSPTRASEFTVDNIEQWEYKRFFSIVRHTVPGSPIREVLNHCVQRHGLGEAFKAYKARCESLTPAVSRTLDTLVQNMNKMQETLESQQEALELQKAEMTSVRDEQKTHESALMTLLRKIQEPQPLLLNSERPSEHSESSPPLPPPISSSSPSIGLGGLNPHIWKLYKSQTNCAGEYYYSNVNTRQTFWVFPNLSGYGRCPKTRTNAVDLKLYDNVPYRPQ